MSSGNVQDGILGATADTWQHDAVNLPNIEFPKGFLWGSSTSAFQIEGGCTNNDWYRAGEQGRYQEKCGQACNHYAMYREDVDLIRQLGHGNYRFSIEWSRIETSEGVFDAEATKRYVDLCRRLVAAGIIGWNGEDLEPYRKMARGPVNRAVTQLVREKGVREAVGLGDGRSLLDRYVVVSPGVSGEVSIPGDRCAGTTLTNVVTGARLTGAERDGTVAFTVPISGVYEMG